MLVSIHAWQVRVVFRLEQDVTDPFFELSCRDSASSSRGNVKVEIHDKRSHARKTIPDYCPQILQRESQGACGYPVLGADINAWFQDCTALQVRGSAGNGRWLRGQELQSALIIEIQDGHRGYCGDGDGDQVGFAHFSSLPTWFSVRCVIYDTTQGGCQAIISMNSRGAREAATEASGPNARTR